MRELRRLFATLLQVVRLRFELVSVELDEQVAYAANVLIWILVALFCASLGIDGFLSSAGRIYWLIM